MYVLAFNTWAWFLLLPQLQGGKERKEGEEEGWVRRKCVESLDGQRVASLDCLFTLANSHCLEEYLVTVMSVCGKMKLVWQD